LKANTIASSIATTPAAVVLRDGNDKDTRRGQNNVNNKKLNNTIYVQEWSLLGCYAVWLF
jgi:hypothetical protein